MQVALGLIKSLNLHHLKPKNIQPYKRSMARVEIDTDDEINNLPVLFGAMIAGMLNQMLGV